MGTYYVRDFADLAALPEEYTATVGTSFVDDGPGLITQTVKGSSTSAPTSQEVSVNRSFYTKAHGNGDSSFVELSITTDEAGPIAFWRKVESEGCCDFYRFYIDGVQQESVSGVTGWTRVQFNVAAGDHVFRWYFSTDGSVLTGISGFRIASIEVAGANPNPTPSTTGTAGAGGGTSSSGIGNMFGAFALGSTMLGADPGSGTGGAGGSGAGNMLGSFWLGQTMLGADPGGGTSDAPAPASGSIFPVAASIAGLANVTGAFATFVFPVAGAPAGVAVVQNAYLNSNWALDASTINNTNGVTIFRTTYPTGSHLDPTSGQVQGVRTQTGTWYFKVGTSTGTNTYGTAFKTSRITGAESSLGGFSSGGAISWTFDAGADHFISRVELRDASNRLVATWGWSVQPGAEVFATIFSPIGLRSAVDVGATVTGDMSQHVLRSNTIEAGATVEATAVTVVNLKSQFIGASGTVEADLQNIKDLYADSVGDSAVQAEAVLTDVVFGTSDVTGDLIIHNTRGRATGIATVVGNMRRNEGFQGDGIGDSEVVADFFLQMLLEASTSAGEATVTTNLTYPAPLSGGQADGTSTATGLLAIYNLTGTTSQGDAVITGHLGYAGPVRFSGASAGEASIKFEMRIRGVFGPQRINGDSTVTCPALIRVWFVDGAPAGEATVAPLDMVIHTIPPGPIVGESTVVAHATHDARYGGEIEGDSSVAPTFPYVQTTVGTGTSQGTADVRGRLYVRPQDFEASTSDGTASLVAQILISDLALRGTSVGGRIHLLVTSGPNTGQFTSPPQYNDVLVKGYLASKAPFAPVTIVGYAEFERAILLLNDSGLITGGSRLDAFLDFKTGVGEGTARGYAVNRGQFDFASDLAGTVTDAYTGVGIWFKDGFARIYHYDYSLTMAPIKDINPYTGEDHTGLPGNAVWHGNSLFEYQGVSTAQNATRDTWRGGHVWDGSYEDWILQDLPTLDWRQFPELWDPDLGSTTNPTHAQPYRSFPGAIRRKYALAQRGTHGTWMVDTRGPGFMDKAMRANPVGEARFDEPQSTVDMDLELKSSMKGRIVGHAEVTAVALLLSFRSLIQEGNVTVLRHLVQAMKGNAAKSPEALLPMTRDNVDRLNPVRQSNAMYV